MSLPTASCRRRRRGLAAAASSSSLCGALLNQSARHNANALLGLPSLRLLLHVVSSRFVRVLCLCKTKSYTSDMPHSSGEHPGRSPRHARSMRRHIRSYFWLTPFLRAPELRARAPGDAGAVRQRTSVLAGVRCNGQMRANSIATSTLYDVAVRSSYARMTCMIMCSIFSILRCRLAKKPNTFDPTSVVARAIIPAATSNASNACPECHTMTKIA